MNYVERNLRKNESLIAKAKISWIPIIPGLIFAFLIIFGAKLLSDVSDELEILSLICIAFAVLYIIIKIIQISSIELGVTNKKIIGKTGVVIAQSLDTYLEKIDNFSISETLGGKIFGYSTIQISTTSARLRFAYVKDAMTFKNTVMDAIDAREDERLRKQAEYIGNLSQSVSGTKPFAASPVNQQPNGVFCRVCGAKYSPNAAFCPNCGSTI